MHRSILGHLLPEAMVCFLENYTAEKFAEIFLGEFDTPEVIWSSEMRRLLIEKISTHIADFTPRLRGHTMARYIQISINYIDFKKKTMIDNISGIHILLYQQSVIHNWRMNYFVIYTICVIYVIHRNFQIIRFRNQFSF